MTLAFAGFLSAGLRTQAQTVQVLLDWTGQWRYHQAGTELGTDWRNFSYPAEANAPWNAPSSGLLGFEDAGGAALYAVHAPINTTLASSMTITTYYFRATFQFSGTTAGLSLIASNLVDDGAVMYLNGTEIGRFRVPANQRASTFASGSPAAEGVLESINITNLSLLRQGANVMAVEAHRVSAFGSGDMIHGMKVMSIRAIPLNITTQPQSQTVVAGQALSLSVAVSGGPAAYRWFKGGVVVTGATGPTYAVTQAGPTHGGDYYVVVTNSVSVVTSEVARVTVVSDTVGPEVIDAKGDTNTYAARRGQTIVLNFNETLLLPAATNAENFAVYAGSNFNTRVSFTNITHTNVTTGAGSARIYLWMSGQNWAVGSNYFVVLNNVPDSKGNIIAPNTRVPVSWDNVTNLIQMSDTWEFHQLYVFDPEVYTTTPPWYATNAPPDTLGVWGTGQGIFWYDPSVVTPPRCLDDTANKLISYQHQPSLFRRKFLVPVGFPTNGILRTRFTVDDGMILYLNGKEIYAHNAVSNTTVTANTRARGQVDANCVTNISFPLSLLLPRTNWVAVAVLQSNPEDQSDAVFGLEFDAVVPRTSPLPTDPPASQLILTMAPASEPARQSGQVTLSWPTAFNGYALQFKSDLSPSEPWITVSNQANPFTTSLSGESRLFRLAKP